MKRVWPVARREYLERVRTKAFVFATLVAPALMAGLFMVPGLVMQKQRGKPLRVAVLDDSGALGGDVEAALARQKAEGSTRFLVQPAGPSKGAAERLEAAVLEGDLDGYLHLPADSLARSEAAYYGKNVSNRMDLNLVEDAVGEVFVSRRLSGEGLDPARVKDLTRKLEMKTIRLSKSGAREDRGASALFSIVLMMMLYMTVIFWGQAVMTGVIEEKSSRVVEVMLSSIPPIRLFAGKILGVGAAGLTQFLVWTATMTAMSLFGGGVATTLLGEKLPEVSPLVMVSFVAYFLLGYFLYASLYAAVGASVNTTQEAQSLVFPIVMPLVVATLFFPAILQSPDSTLSIVLSLVPFLTPILMFLRISVLTPPAWQIALSMGLMGLAIVGGAWGASRIYRVGILMYGKRPTFPEILRWVGKP